MSLLFGVRVYIYMGTGMMDMVYIARSLHYIITVARRIEAT